VRARSVAPADKSGNGRKAVNSGEGFLRKKAAPRTVTKRGSGPDSSDEPQDVTTGKVKGEEPRKKKNEQEKTENGNHRQATDERVETAEKKRRRFPREGTRHRGGRLRKERGGVRKLSDLEIKGDIRPKSRGKKKPSFGKRGRGHADTEKRKG